MHRFSASIRTHFSALSVIALLSLSACGGGGGVAPKTYVISANVTGIGTTLGVTSGNSLVLQNNATDDLTITPTTAQILANSVSGTFATAITDSAAYNVTVKKNPTGRICTVTGGSGNVTANTTVQVSCVQQTVTGAVSTLSGGGGTGTSSGHLDGASTTATFTNPYGITTDGANLYVADYGNNLVRKVVISTGAVTTLAGGGVSGTSFGHADGIGTAATFSSPSGITTDGVNLYVTDSQTNLIRKVVISTGVVSTLAGGGVSGVDPGHLDGVATAATFFEPSGITTDGTNLYVSDAHTNLIRKIVISSGVVTTLAGGGGTGVAAGHADGTGASATFFAPAGMYTDGVNLYVADYGNNLIRKIVLNTGVVTTLVGGGVSGVDSGYADGTGANATFTSPSGISSDGTSLYVTDLQNNLIRKIVIASGVVTTLAGGGVTGTAVGHADGLGAAATFSNPSGITTDGASFYVTDQLSNVIRKIQ